MDALIGYTGFIGNIISKSLKNFDKYNSKNIKFINNDYKTIYCSGVQSKKWWANENPDEDWLGIELLINSVKNINCEKFILISTIGVYENDPYGVNRKKLEDILINVFGDKLKIYRLPAVFGDGLKKNLLFDMINNELRHPINIKDMYQWYNVNNIMEDIANTINDNSKVIEFFTEPIENNELIKIFNKNFNFYNDIENCYIQDIKPKDGYWMKKSDVISELNKFIHGNN